MNFILLVIALILGAIGITLKEINRKLNKMPTRADLDAALTALVSSFTDLTTALNTLAAAIAALPPPGSDDFTPEIGEVQQAAAGVAAAQTSIQNDINALQPPPPPGPQKPS